MTHRHAAVVTFVATTAMISACSSAASPESAAGKSSPTLSTATARQYGAALSGPVTKVQMYWLQYQLECPSPGYTCSATTLLVRRSAETLDATITSIGNPASAEYVGRPPAALAKLLTRTGEDARLVYTDVDDTGQASAALYNDAAALSTDCDAWSPYLG